MSLRLSLLQSSLALVMMGGGAAYAACHPYVAVGNIKTAIEKGGTFADGVQQAKAKGNLDQTAYCYEETVKIIQTSPTYKRVKMVMDAEQGQTLN